MVRDSIDGLGFVARSREPRIVRGTFRFTDHKNARLNSGIVHLLAIFCGAQLAEQLCADGPWLSLGIFSIVVRVKQFPGNPGGLSLQFKLHLASPREECFHANRYQQLEQCASNLPVAILGIGRGLHQVT